MQIAQENWSKYSQTFSKWLNYLCMITKYAQPCGIFANVIKATVQGLYSSYKITNKLTWFYFYFINALFIFIIQATNARELLTRDAFQISLWTIIFE